MADEAAVSTEFLRVARREFQQCLVKIEKAVEKLSGAQIWARTHEQENSVGNLLLHLSGNVRQWIVSGLGGAPDNRERDAEFAQREAMPATELIAGLRATVQEADAVLGRLSADDLTAKYAIQGFQPSGLYAVFHVVEHFGEHTGQILWIAKHHAGDLGFFKNLSGSGEANSGGEPTVA